MTKKKVLIVDDELDINLLFKTILEDNGFKVDTFDDPLLALQNFKANSYDLLLLDIVMPKMNGFDLYGKIRMIDHKVKVCFITASDVYDEQIRKEAFPELGYLKDCFIPKPIKNEDLIERVNNIISSA
jgi:DNA-binding response OmpR family regulator